MDVFLSQVNGALDSLDVFMGPVESLAFGLDFLQFSHHNFAFLDALVDSCLELLNHRLYVSLHLLHVLLVHAFHHFAFDLQLLL